MHKIFISYHSDNENNYKEYMVNRWDNKMFINESVEKYDISDSYSDEKIRTIIRDDYLKNSSVTIVLLGKCTKHRKHIDWEIGSSMINGSINKVSGIVVIEVPNKNNKNLTSGIFSEELKNEINLAKKRPWSPGGVPSINRHPNLSERLMINCDKDGVEIPILQWEDIIINENILKEAINFAYDNRYKQKYDTSLKFRRHNNNSCY